MRRAAANHSHLIIVCICAAACAPPALAPPALDADTAASLPGRWAGPGGDLTLSATGAFSRNFTEGVPAVVSGRWTGAVGKSGSSSTGEITLELSCGGGGTVSATVAAQLVHEANDFVTLNVRTVNGRALENGLLPDEVAAAVTAGVPAGARQRVRELIESLSASYFACSGCAGEVPASGCAGR